MTFSRVLIVAIFTLLIGGCSSVKVTDYRDNKPVMVLESFFNGLLVGHGVIKNRSGKVIRSFSVDIKASWENGVGTLDENFIFNDGETQQRIWTLTKNVDGSYSGTAGDVVGQARIHASGNSLFLDYLLTINYDGNEIDLRIDDRMYLLTDRLLLNESTLLKWGFEVGEIILTIENISEEALAN
ncbi:MAG: hypothetical protein ACI845_000276 [Gammaproteobacteria bacterium]|jgi:hypothetical protein